MKLNTAIEYLIGKLTLLVTITFLQPGKTYGQCIEGTGPNPPNPVVVACNGSPQVITATGQAGEFSEVSVTAGTTYTFSSSNPGDFITIYIWPTEVSGTTPVTFISPGTGVVQFFTHTDAACGTSTIPRTRSVTCGLPLPVTLTAFNGRWSNSRVQLQWSTLTEKNNAGFEVQHSEDGKTFYSSGFVKSQASGGCSSRRLEYLFYDDNAASGTLSYRLLQQDKDGKVSVSDIIQLSVPEHRSLSVIATPNPVMHELRICLVGKPADNASLTLLSVSGQILGRVADPGAETKLDMISYAPGIYFIKYNDALQSQVLRVCKQ